MLKKVTLMAALAIQLLLASTLNGLDVPWPSCMPCPEDPPASVR